MRARHLVRIGALSRSEVLRLLDRAERLEPVARGEQRSAALRGRVLVSLFFEPSTRTRLSFATAFQRLGGSVVELVGVGSSSLAKGESLVDTGRVVSGYGDVIVVRHPAVGSAAELARGATVPVISGGDGTGEHPTQALLDLYAIRRECGRLDGCRLALIGDLRHGRTAHSLVRALSLFEGVQIDAVAPPGLELPQEILRSARQAGVELRSMRRLEQALPHAQVIYQTRLQQERFSTPTEAARHRGQLALDRATYERLARPGTPILHPLPRDAEAGELSTDLDELPELACFRQAHGGVPVRMALFLDMLQPAAEPGGGFSRSGAAGAPGSSRDTG